MVLLSRIGQVGRWWSWQQRVGCHAHIVTKQLVLEVREGAGEVHTCPDSMMGMRQRLFSQAFGKLIACGSDSRECAVHAHIMTSQLVLL